MRAATPSLWSRLVRVARPVFQSEMRGRAWGGLTLLLVLLLSMNGINVVNSYVGRDFMTALAERRIADFYFFAALFAGVFAISTVVLVFSSYVEHLLGLGWRQWLSRRFVDRYLAGRVYLRLIENQQIDNPDERISNDVMIFTQTTLSFLVMIFNGIVTLLAFSGVLWLITPWLFVTALGYAIAGSFGTILLGRRLIPLNNLQLQKEADFRYGLGRVREHAEAIAQMAGEREQRGRLDQWLTQLVDNYRKIISLTRNVGFFTVAFGYFPQIIPALVVAHLYFQGVVEFGAVTQAAMAFAQVQGAFSLIVTQFQQVTTYAAIVQRLGAMWEATEPAPVAPAIPLPRIPTAKVPTLTATAKTAKRRGLVVRSPAAHRLKFDHVTLRSADDHRSLIRDLSLDVPEGKRLAITGPSLLGKTILRAAAGLWDEGEGRIILPDPDALMFVPQHPYEARGRLRDILREGLDKEIPDERLLATLHDVCMADVVAKEGGLESEKDWSTVLAPGELCTLAFARLLLASPRFAFLESPGEALKELVARRVYEALRRSSITYITVGCPHVLISYHDLRLELREDGSWRTEIIANAPSE